MVRLLDELEVELIEVRLDVHALQLRVDVLVHQHEVTVDLKSTVFSQNDADLVVLAVFAGFAFGYSAVLY